MENFKNELFSITDELRGSMRIEEVLKVIYSIASAKYISDLCYEAEYLRIPHKLSRYSFDFNRIQDYNSFVNEIEKLKDLSEAFHVLLGNLLDNRHWKNIEKVIYSVKDINFSTNILRGNYKKTASELIGILYSHSSPRDEVITNTFSINEIIAKLLKIDKDESLLDPCIGYGNMALTVGEKAKEISGIEINEYPWAVSKICHNLANLEGDILLGDSLIDKTDQKDVIVSFPPMSLRRVNDETLMKYNKWGKIPVKKSSDLAFLSMSLELAKKRGALIIPDGVLFRGGSEGQIRKNIIRDKYIEAIISLPSGAISYTAIKTNILIFNKEKTNNDILLIDGEEFFKKIRGSVSITDENIETIISLFENKSQKRGISRLVSVEEVLENEGILNVNRYITPVTEEFDMNGAAKKLEELKEAKNRYESKTDEIYKELFYKSTDSLKQKP